MPIWVLLAQLKSRIKLKFKICGFQWAPCTLAFVIWLFRNSNFCVTIGVLKHIYSFFIAATYTFSLYKQVRALDFDTDCSKQRQLPFLYAIAGSNQLYLHEFDGLSTLPRPTRILCNSNHPAAVESGTRRLTSVSRVWTLPDRIKFKLQGQNKVMQFAPIESQNHWILKRSCKLLKAICKRNGVKQKASLSGAYWSRLTTSRLYFLSILLVLRLFQITFVV